MILESCCQLSTLIVNMPKCDSCLCIIMIVFFCFVSQSLSRKKFVRKWRKGKMQLTKRRKRCMNWCCNLRKRSDCLSFSCVRTFRNNLFLYAFVKYLYRVMYVVFHLFWYIYMIKSSDQFWYFRPKSLITKIKQVG